MGQREENKTRDYRKSYQSNYKDKVITCLSDQKQIFQIAPNIITILLGWIERLEALKNKEVNHCRYYRCNNTHIYSNNYLVTQRVDKQVEFP